MSITNLPQEILDYIEEKKRVMKSVQRFLKSKGLYRRLRNFSKTVNGSGRDGNLILNAGGGSFTDGKSVTVGLPEMNFEDSNAIKLNVLKALVAHEFGHLKFSDFVVFRQIQERTDAFFKTEYGLSMGGKVGANLLNCTEDGRMEKLQANELPGLLKYFQYLNLRALETKVMGEDALSDFIMSVCLISVLGITSEDFNDVYGGTEMEDAIDKCRPYIIKAINTRSPKKCADITFEMIEANGDFIASLMQQSMDEAEQNGGESSLENMEAAEEYSGKPSEGRHNQGVQSDNNVEVHVVPESKNSKPQQSKSQSQQDDKSDQSQSSSSSNSSQRSQEDSQEQQSGNEAKGQESEELQEDSSGGTNNDDKSEEESESTGDDSGDEKKEPEQGDLFDFGNEDEDKDSNEKSDKDESKDGTDGSKGSEESKEDSTRGEDSQSQGSKNEGSGKDTKEDKSVGDMGEMIDQPDLNDESGNIDLKEEMFDVKAALDGMKDKFEEENAEVIQDIHKEDKRIEQDEKRDEKEKEKYQLDNKTLSYVMQNGGGSKSFEYRNADLSNRETLPHRIQLLGKNLNRNLRKILQNKAGVNRENTRVGIFDSNQAHRFATGDVDLFKRYGTPEDTDYAFSLLLDNSGSMGGTVRDESGDVIGTKVECVREACAVIEEGLRGLVPFKIQQFDTYYSINQDEVRGWQERTKENLSWKLSTKTGGGNADGFSIRVAAYELLKRPEKQKVMIVMSDGLPSDYESHAQAINHVRDVVKEARANGIKVIAIRFGTDRELENTSKDYKHMYEKDFITCSPKDIQKELVKVLKNVTRA